MSTNTTTHCYTTAGVLHVQRVSAPHLGPLVAAVKTGIRVYQKTSDLKQALTGVADVYATPPGSISEDKSKLDKWFYEAVTAMCLVRVYVETGCNATVIRIPAIKPSSTRIDHTLPAQPSNLRPMSDKEWEQKLMFDIRARPDHYYHEQRPRQDDSGAFILLDGHDADAWTRQGEWLEMQPVRKWADFDELKDLTGYTTKELRKMADLPGAPFIRIGRKFRTDVHEFTRWAESL